VRRTDVPTIRKLSSTAIWIFPDPVEDGFAVGINLFAIVLEEKPQTLAVSGPGLRCCFLVTANAIQLNPFCLILFWKYGHKLKELN